MSAARADFVVCRGGHKHTWGKRLLELLCLLAVLDNEGVEVAVAADLELGLARGGALLDARG